MTIRNVTLIGLLGVGITLGGCNTAPPPAANATADSQPAANASAAPAPAQSTVPAADAGNGKHRRSEQHEQQAANDGNAAPAPATDADNSAPAQEIIVETAPPPPRIEQVVVRPGYVWTPGFWRWDPSGRRHTWIGGSYVPQRPGFAWVPGRWLPAPHHSWRFQPGYWAPRAGGQFGPQPGPNRPPVAGGPINNQPPPPPRRIEPVVQRPGFIWTPGYWRWDGNHYVWAGGAYRPARQGFNWVAEQWVQGPRGGWHLQEGHWQHR